nr:hypothetical protein [Saprospiraceae bacterium]
MPFTTYEEIRSYGEMIKFVLENKIMPPWLPKTDYSKIQHDRTVSDEEILLIKNWVDGGMQPGNLKPNNRLKIPGERGDKSGSFTSCMEHSFEQYGIYKDQYQVFVIPLNNPHPLLAKNIQLQPGNKKIVRSCKVSVGTSDKWASMDDWDPRYGYYSFGGLGAVPSFKYWHSWSPFNPDSKEAIKFLPPKSILLFEVHYGPTGAPGFDSTCVSFDTLSFGKDNALVRSGPLLNLNNISKKIDSIPSNKTTRVHSSIELPFAVQIHALTPEANLLCRNMEVYATKPSGEVIPLLKITDWLIDWAEKYHFEESIVLPKGTVIHSLVTYNNTTENPHNPAYPPISMKWGHGMFRERFEMVFDYSLCDTINSNFRLAPVPSVENGENVRIDYYSEKTDTVTVELVSLSKENYSHKMKFPISRGPGFIGLPTSKMPIGNYHLKIVDSRGSLIAEDFLILLREVGFFR